MSRFLVTSLCVSMGLVVSQASFAQEQVTNNANSGSAQSSTLSDSSTNLAYWNLQGSEIERLQELKQKFRPFADVELMSPFEILGLGADTEAERAKYAQSYIKARSEHQRATIAWAVTVASVDSKMEDHGDFLRQDPNINRYLTENGSNGVVDNGLVPSSPSPASSAIKTDQYHLFIPIACGRCQMLYGKALQDLIDGEITKINLVFTTDYSNEQIIAWTDSVNMDVDLLAKQDITLNRMTSSWGAIVAGRKLPILVNSGTGDAFD